MTATNWLRVTIPMQAVLIFSQLLTGLNRAKIPDETYEVVHEGGGILLVTLVVIHVILNRDWLWKHYGRRSGTK